MMSTQKISCLAVELKIFYASDVDDTQSGVFCRSPITPRFFNRAARSEGSVPGTFTAAKHILDARASVPVVPFGTVAVSENRRPIPGGSTHLKILSFARGFFNLF